jgi:hypothetical protein
VATKVEIAADIRRQYGNVLSRNQVREYLGMGNDAVTKFLEDVPFMRDSRKKRYLAIDVAKKYYERQQTAF